MDTIKRTVEVGDERQAGKSLEANARGFRENRFEKVPNVTINDIGVDQRLKLREGDDREAMIAAIRADAVKKYGFTVVKSPESEDAEVYEEPLEAVEVNPGLTALREQYENLSDADRTYNGKVRSFEEVLKAVPHIDNLLAEMATLEQGIVYFLSEGGELIVGDGCAEPLKETLGWNYDTSRSKATRISYVDDKGAITTIEGDDIKVPEGVKIVSKRGLISLDEYERLNRGKFEVNSGKFKTEKVIWTESGKNPSVARRAFWYRDGVSWADYDPSIGTDLRGSRRVLRVKLNFES